MAPPLTPQSAPLATRCTVQKRLLPGAAGTRRLAQRFGPALVCVRYRHDPETGRRYTTVELVVEERPGRPSPEVLVKVAFGETALRSRIKDAGGSWDPARRLWRLPLHTARSLGLGKRVVKDGQ